MRAMARWLRHVGPFGLVVLVGAGCGGAGDNGMDQATTTSSVATAGQAVFVAEARTMTFGTKDLTSASERELLRLGEVVCDGLGIQGLGFRRVIQRLVQSEAHPTPVEATALVKSAVRNLCPQQAGAIPGEGGPPPASRPA